jgi:regulatory protein
MEERAQGDGSSSQSVNITITSVSERGAFVGINLSNSSSFFILIDDFPAIKPFTGKVLDNDALKELEYWGNVCLTYKKALDILSFASNTAFMLKQKLAKKGFPAQFIDAAVKKLTEKNFIDDKKFAENWVELRLAKNPESPAMLRAALMRKGVESTVINEVLKDLTPQSEIYMESFERALAKLRRRSKSTPDKVKVALVRKGYPISLVNRYVGRGDDWD